MAKRSYEELISSICGSNEMMQRSSNSILVIGTLGCANWKEENITDSSPLFSTGKKISKVNAAFTVTSKEGEPNQLDGRADVDWIMHYSNDDKENPHAAVAEYNGIMKVSGKLNGKEGHFYCQEIGKYKNFKAESVLTVLPNSGTGDLVGISGHGLAVSSFGGDSYLKLIVKFDKSEGDGEADSLDRKEIATSFLKLSSSGKVEEAFTLVDETAFKHHNIHFAGDLLSLKNAMIDSHVKMPNKALSVKKVLEEGDHVTTLSLIKLSDEMSLTVCHLFKFNDAQRIIELWDIGQVLPEKIPNENGPF